MASNEQTMAEFERLRQQMSGEQPPKKKFKEGHRPKTRKRMCSYYNWRGCTKSAEECKKHGHLHEESREAYKMALNKAKEGVLRYKRNAITETIAPYRMKELTAIGGNLELEISENFKIESHMAQIEAQAQAQVARLQALGAAVEQHSQGMVHSGGYGYGQAPATSLEHGGYSQATPASMEHGERQYDPEHPGYDQEQPQQQASYEQMPDNIPDEEMRDVKRMLIEQAIQGGDYTDLTSPASSLSSSSSSSSPSSSSSSSSSSSTSSPSIARSAPSSPATTTSTSGQPLTQAEQKEVMKMKLGPEESSAPLSLEERIKLKKEFIKASMSGERDKINKALSDIYRKYLEEDAVEKVKEDIEYKRLMSEKKVLDNKAEDQLAAYRRDQERREKEKRLRHFGKLELETADPEDLHRMGMKHRYDVIAHSSLGPLTPQITPRNRAGIEALYINFYKRVCDLEKGSCVPSFVCNYCRRSLHAQMSVVTDRKTTMRDQWLLCRRCLGVAYCCAAHREADRRLHEFSCALHPGWEVPEKGKRSKKYNLPLGNDAGLRLQFDKAEWGKDLAVTLKRSQQALAKIAQFTDPTTIKHAHDCGCVGCLAGDRYKAADRGRAVSDDQFKDLFYCMPVVVTGVLKALKAWKDSQDPEEILEARKERETGSYEEMLTGMDLRGYTDLVRAAEEGRQRMHQLNKEHQAEEKAKEKDAAAEEKAASGPRAAEEEAASKASEDDGEEASAEDPVIVRDDEDVEEA